MTVDPTPTLGAPAPAPDARRTTVVIVDYDAREHLPRAVASVLADADADARVLVVDNASRVPSADFLGAWRDDPRVALVRLERNIGFAAACNEGIRRSDTPFVMLLNPDCRLRAGALARLHAVLEEWSKAGMAGPLLLNPDGTEQRGGRRDIPNPWQIFCFVTGLHRLLPKHPRFRNFNRIDEPLPARATAVHAISGACMLIRRTAIDKVGFLDSERFFMHFEDIDWCMRFGQAGYDVAFVPDAVAEHEKGVSSASVPIRVAYYKHVSLIRFLRKHFIAFYPSIFVAGVSALVMLRLGWVVARISLRGTINSKSDI